jgi:hypothetical protein
VACEDSIAYVIDIEKEKIRTKLAGHAFRITCLAYHPDGTHTPCNVHSFMVLENMPGVSSRWGKISI